MCIVLIKFDSRVGGFTMAGDIALQLLQAMGHSGTVPGAILAADIPAALARLKAVVAAAPGIPEHVPDDAEKDGKALPVSLRQRAWPLVDLLTRAAAKGAEVMWTQEGRDGVRHVTA
jgi:hypothetical protein